MTKIDVINRALLKLGEPPISSLSGTDFGRSFELIYEDVKSLLLSAYPWRFAVTLKNIPLCAEKFGERSMYKLPTDCLLLLSVFGIPTQTYDTLRAQTVKGYEVVEDYVVTPVTSGVQVEYVRKISDTDKMSPLFVEALATKIASEQCMRLKNALNLKQMLDDEYFYLIRQAELNNEIIKDTELMPDNSWVLVREVWN